MAKKKIKKDSGIKNEYWKLPEGLNEYAKDKWLELVPIFLEENVLTKADRTALVELCKNYGEAEGIYQSIITEYKSIYKYFEGKNSQTAPEWNAYIRFTQAYMKLLSEFGMTPAARKRVEGQEIVNEIDPMENLLE